MVIWLILLLDAELCSILNVQIVVLVDHTMKTIAYNSEDCKFLMDDSVQFWIFVSTGWMFRYLIVLLYTACIVLFTEDPDG